MVTRETPLNREGIRLAELSVGDTFGEEALISEAKRNATVTMLTDGVLMRLSKEDFRELMNEPLQQWVGYPEARETHRSAAASWLDVRLPSEYQNLAIEGALNIPLYFIRLKLATLDRDVPYVVYCDTGRRSAAGGLHPAGARLRRLRAAGAACRAPNRNCAARASAARGAPAAAALHGVRGFVAGERAGEVVLDLVARLAAILVAELHADAGRALALRTLGRHPDDAARHRQLLVLAHEVQQHEDFVADAVVAVGRDEQPAVGARTACRPGTARSCP